MHIAYPPVAHCGACRISCTISVGQIFIVGCEIHHFPPSTPFLLVQIPISQGQIQFMNTRSPFPIVKSLVLIRKSPFFMLNSQFGIIESQFSTVESNFFDDKIPFLMGKSQYWITQSLNIHFLWSNPTFGSLNPHEIHIFPPMLDHSNPHFRSNKSTFCGWPSSPISSPISAGAPLPKAFANSTLLPRTPFTSKMRSNSWMTGISFDRGY